MGNKRCPPHCLLFRDRWNSADTRAHEADESDTCIRGGDNVTNSSVGSCGIRRVQPGEGLFVAGTIHDTVRPYFCVLETAPVFAIGAGFEVQIVHPLVGRRTRFPGSLGDAFLDKVG
jgi:hypothetical protein